KLASIIGHKGDLSAGVFKITIGREARMHGHPIGNTMGVNTWAAFSGTNDQAVVDGDFAMTESELQPVLKALRHADMQIVAILERVADVLLPGPPVRLDYQSIDTTADRLYISHMNAGELIVFDMNARKVEGTVGDLPRITGVCSVPALGKVYASVPGHHHVAV